MATLVFILDDQQEIVVPILGLTPLGCVDGNDVVVEDPQHCGASRGDQERGQSNHVAKF